MTVAVTPATIFDMAALSGAMTVLEWRIAKQMWRHGECHAVRAGGKLAALGYLYPLPGGTAEAGFNFSREENDELTPAAPHMLGICRAIRLTLRATPYRAIVTECRTEAGARLARAAGFQPSGVRGVVGEIWAYGGHADRADLEAAAPGAGGAAGAGGGGTAPLAGADGAGAG